MSCEILAGTVTSIDITPPAEGIAVSGGPIITSGVFVLSLTDDLAALEALTGVNTIYYRSGVSTWTAVVIGDNLAFVAGVLSAPLASGSVTNVKLANMPAYTIKANITGSSAAPQDVAEGDLPPDTPVSGDWVMGWLQTGEQAKFPFDDFGGGGTDWTFSSQTSSFTAGITQKTYYLWDVSDPFGGDPAMELPPASGNTGLVVGVQCVSGGDPHGWVQDSASNTLYTFYSVGDYVILVSDGTSWIELSRNIQNEQGYPEPCNFRISTESGVPVSSLDRTSQGTVYLVPMGIGNRLLLPNYEQTGFIPTYVSNLYWTVSGSSGDTKDLYIWLDAGVPTTVLSPAWSSSTSRGTGSGTAEQDTLWNITVNKYAMGSMPAYGGLYVGTIRLTGTNVTEDSEAKRFVMSAYNKVPRHVRCFDSSTRFTSSATYVQVGSVQVAFITDGKQSIHFFGSSACYNSSSSSYGSLAIGTGTTTVSGNCRQSLFGAGFTNTVYSAATAELEETPALGLVTYYLLMATVAGGTAYVDGQTILTRPGTSLGGLIQC